MSSSTQISIGLLVPPADDWIPPDCTTLYPHIRFVSCGLGITKMSAHGFDEVRDLIVARSIDLKCKGAQVVAIMGASLTFYRGEAFNQTLIRAVARATSLPVSSMSTAMINALRANGIRRVALATAYNDKLNFDLVKFLNEHDIAVTAAKGLGLTNISSVRPTSPATIRDLAKEVFQLDPSADGILISCGGLPTLALHVELERNLGVTAVSSFPAGLWDVVQLAGHNPRVPNVGRLFEIGIAEKALHNR